MQYRLTHITKYAVVFTVVLKSRTSTSESKIKFLTYATLETSVAWLNTVQTETEIDLWYPKKRIHRDYGSFENIGENKLSYCTRYLQIQVEHQKTLKRAFFLIGLGGFTMLCGLFAAMKFFLHAIDCNWNNVVASHEVENHHTTGDSSTENLFKVAHLVAHCNLNFAVGPIVIALGTLIGSW